MFTFISLHMQTIKSYPKKKRENFSKGSFKKSVAYQKMCSFSDLQREMKAAYSVL